VPNQCIDNWTVATENGSEVLSLLWMTLKQGQQFLIVVMKQRFDNRVIGFGKMGDLHNL
jgi:hypothetical protein